MSEHIVGIDFGTSTTLIADRNGPGRARVLPIGRTLPWLPSIAGWSRGDELLVGEAAEGLGASRLIRSVKRNITEGKEIIELALPGGGTAELKTRDVVLAILKEATARASSQKRNFFKGRIQMGCPAVWDGDQRQSLVSLAQDAGLPLEIADLVDEPIAAGVSWVWNRWQQAGERPHGNVLVFDYGGGTLDVALIEVTGDDVPEITVLAAAGVAEAGDSLDEAIAGDLRRDLEKQRIRVDHLPDPEVAERLLVLAARQLKHTLTESDDTTARLGGDYHDVPDLRYSRKALETAFAPQLEKAMRLVVGVLKSARLRQQGVSPDRVAHLAVNDLAKDVQYVLLAGGLSRVPCVRQRFQKTFPKAVVEHDTLLGTPEESVVSGLAFGEAYSRLNLDRPAFDLVVDYDGAGSRVPPAIAYRAFTPLYNPADVMRGMFLLGHRADLTAPAGLRGVIPGRLSCRSSDGTVFDFRINGAKVGALSFSVRSGQPGWIKLYADGRILLKDHYFSREFRVTRWPVLRSPDHIVDLEDLTPSQWRDYDEPGWWHGGN